MSILMETYIPGLQANGFVTGLPVTINSDLTVTGTTNIAGVSLTDLTVTGNTVIGNAASDTLGVTGLSTFTSATTTGVGVTVVANALTTGSGISVTSSSADVSARALISATNSAAAAVGAAPVAVTNAGVTGTGSKWVRAFQATSGAKTVTIWIGLDGTDPNGALTGVAGDIVLNGPSSKIAYCTGTTNWTTITSA